MRFRFPRLVRWLAGGLGVCFLALLALAARDVLRIRSAIERGQQQLQSLDVHTVSERGNLAAVAADASAELDHAAEIARSSPWLGALTYVPVLRSEANAVRDLARASSDIGHLGRGTAERVQTALDRSAQQGSEGRLQLVDEFGRAIDDLRGQLDQVDLGARGWLLPPLASARDRLVQRLRKTDGQLSDAHRLASALNGFLSGPRHYLVLGGNNAEMRSLGVASTAGEATVNDGAVHVGAFLQTADVDLAYPGVSIPSDWKELYGWLGPGQAYTSAVMSPNFPAAAEVSSRISEHNPIGRVDGVIYVDTVTLQSLLQVIGPVTVDGTTYDGTNAAMQLINQNYLRFQTSNEAPERRDAQSRVANAIFDALNDRHFPLTKLAAALVDLAQGRHLLAWSSDPAENDLWVQLGANGETGRDDLILASQDLGGSKLDYYVTIEATGTVVHESDRRHFDLSITLTNPRRDVTSSYINGGSIYAAPGEYGSFFVVYLPADAFEIGSSDPGIGRNGPDGDLKAASMLLRVPEGTSKTIRFAFSLPLRDETIRVLPSGRLRPVAYNLNGFAFNDATPMKLDLNQLSPDPGPIPMWFTVGLLLFGLGACFVGDGWGHAAVAAADDRVVRQRARLDAEVGWWLMIVGLAMVTVQVTIYVTLR